MPTFGDFETVGEPFAVSDERSHVSTIWQARRGSSGPPVFAIKCFAPRRESLKPTESEEALDQDRSLGFLEGVKQLKKAQATGGRGLAPIHALGLTELGAWYATDFYPGKTLREFIALRGRVDGPALQHIVHSILTGCLALRRSRGFSHGNLKSSNVFLAGRPRPLRSRPFHLADASPAGPLQASALSGGEKRTVDDLLHEVVEAQDLRAIGELILQLVEGRLVSSSYEYNYPVAHSSAWEQLGNDADKWRQLCNRLLDPQLTLASVNLDSLEKELRPSAISGRLPLILGAAAAVSLLAAGGFFGFTALAKRSSARRAAEYDQAYRSAHDAFAATNLAVAQQQIAIAVRAKPGDPAAANLRGAIEKQVNDACASNLASARQALAQGNFQLAANLAGSILSLRPGDAEAKRMQTEASHAVELASRNLELQRQYANALSSAQSALQKNDLPEAQRLIEQALSLQPREPAALALKSNILNARQYADAMREAQTAQLAGNHSNVLSQVAAALRARPQDAEALRMRSEAEKALTETRDRATTNQLFADAMNGARAAFRATNFPGAAQKVAEALRVKPAEPSALQLRTEITAAQELALKNASEEAQFGAAWERAREAYRNHDYAETLTNLNTALRLKPQDDTARQLQQDATRLAKIDRDFNNALSSATSAFKATNYLVAEARLKEAFDLKPGDPAATKLKDQIKAAQVEDARLAGIDRDFNEAIRAARAALAATNYAAALNKVDAAINLKPAEPSAKTLRTEIQAAKSRTDAEIQATLDYGAALAAAQTALSNQDYGTAITRAKDALRLKPSDPAATKLQGDAEAAKAEADHLIVVGRTFTNALNRAQIAFAAGDRSNALIRVEEALSAIPGEPTAKKLKESINSAIQAEKARLESIQAEFAANMRDATNAFAATNFTLASAKLGRALEINPADPSAQLLKQRIDGLQKTLEQAAVTNKAFAGFLTNAQNALGSNDFRGALASLKLAALLKPNDPSLTGLRTRVEEAKKKFDSDNLLTHPSRSIFGIDFAWVPGLGVNQQGAYVATGELSWAQYTHLLQQLSQPPKPTTEDEALPARFTSYSEAIKFVNSLNTLPGPNGQTSAKGTWRLPTLEEYKNLTDTPLTIDNRGSWSLSATDFDALREKENMAGSSIAQNRTGKPQKAAVGPANSLGLRYVLGNVREWASNGGAGQCFGVSYLTEGQTALSRALNNPTAPPPSEAIGIRLVYEPPD